MSALRRFSDRREAGRILAAELDGGRITGDPLVLGLARGGMPVAAEIASRLSLPLDVMVVRKVGLPRQPELALGAVASGGTAIVNREVASAARLDEATVQRLIAAEAAELERREAVYRAERPRKDPRGRPAIVIDDGLATGSSMVAAIRALRTDGVAGLTIAVPVAPADTLAMLAEEAKDVVCPLVPSPFMSVGTWYADFRQVSDEEVAELLVLADP